MMRGNLPGPKGWQALCSCAAFDDCLAIGSVSWGVLASAPPHGSRCCGAKPNCIARIYGLGQRGSRRIHTQAPMYRQSIQFPGQGTGVSRRRFMPWGR